MPHPERDPPDHDDDGLRPGRGPVRLPGFLLEEDVGLGSALKRVGAAVGVRPCGGCERRAAALDRWVVFTGRGPG
jgi:hypothetical protein